MGSTGTTRTPQSSPAESEDLTADSAMASNGREDNPLTPPTTPLHLLSPHHLAVGGVAHGERGRDYTSHLNHHHHHRSQQLAPAQSHAYSQDASSHGYADFSSSSAGYNPDAHWATAAGYGGRVHYQSAASPTPHHTHTTTPSPHSSPSMQPAQQLHPSASDYANEAEEQPDPQYHTHPSGSSNSNSSSLTAASSTTASTALRGSAAAYHQYFGMYYNPNSAAAAAHHALGASHSTPVNYVSNSSYQLGQGGHAAASTASGSQSPGQGSLHQYGSRNLQDSGILHESVSGGQAQSQSSWHHV